MKPEAGTQFKIGLETRWSKTDGYCLFYLDGKPEFVYNGPTLFEDSDSAYFKWGSYTNTWRLPGNSRYLYQSVPLLNDKHGTHQTGDALISTLIHHNEFVHDFYTTQDDKRAEFKVM